MNSFTKRKHSKQQMNAIETTTRHRKNILAIAHAADSRSAWRICHALLSRTQLKYLTARYMRLITLLLLLGCMSPTYATNPSDSHRPREVITVNYLYESCSVVGETARGKIPFFDCESYVNGVLDAYLITRPFIPKEKRSCFPTNLPPWKVLEDVKQIIGEGQGSRPAGRTIIEALSKKYPCPQE